jgi:hypothetical protein
MRYFPGHTATSKIGRWSFLAGSRLLLVAVSLFRAVNEASFDRSVPDNWLWFGSSFPPLHLPTFLIGMAVARLFLFGPRRSTKTHVRIFVIAVMATVALLAARQRVPPWGLSTPIIVSLFCCVIYGGARTEIRSSR